jgi:VIT1/CCC1 family predicted Fe2+/Mn2+ transporter
MKNNGLSDKAYEILLKSQKNEATEAIIYTYLSKKEKNLENRKILAQMGADEAAHAMVWKSYTDAIVKPDTLRILWIKTVCAILGYTFTLKMLRKGEYSASDKYKLLESEVPEATEISAHEHGHETSLIAILDEERLKYVGAMVLGLNDALVELTGAIAGITFALASTKLVALSGIVTGISATLSMAASNYLAQKADGNPKALKSSVYTGIAYIITVALMVLPYLLFPDSMYKEAFAVMIATVILIILVFNYYISVAKDQPFFKNFLRMAVISISVAAISFVIALVAKKLLGIETL